MSIYVSNLSDEIEENDLKRIFSEYGYVNKIQISLNQKTGEKRGFAVVEMATGTEEAEAIRALRGIELMGYSLKVNRAMTEYSI
ncbi:MAG: RNA-binding protein [Pelatocladus maniniholoensis HA4357-MV3]|jgi:RNA recognition motif-containing protein|uniref:RNA-binding protein n=1 Tax=Pelatocladus maniniholoensis HA4357-MV3 TaxID=1117104 RepID=A0A9E3LT61_9NOST|nr:RNA-binding protein [Pelatocladus maniniholoensis HA4357-MV3]